MNTDIWINNLVSVSIGEIIAYWSLLLIAVVIAGIGWGFYISEKEKRRSKFIISPFCPFNKIEKGTSIVNEPKEDK